MIKKQADIEIPHTPFVHHNLTEEDKLYLQHKASQRSYYYHRDEKRIVDNNCLLSIASEPKRSEQSEAVEEGSIVALSNEAGEVVESFSYDPYGTILTHTQSEQTLNPYCYTGREFDAHDLYYYRVRYYNPQSGRFLSSDPIEYLSGDYNFYRYVGSDPVNWVDPSGLAAYSDDPPYMKVAMGTIPKKDEAAAKACDAKIEKYIFKPAAFIMGTAWDWSPLGREKLLIKKVTKWSVKKPKTAVKKAEKKVAKEIKKCQGTKPKKAGATVTKETKKKQRNKKPDPDPKAEGRPHSIIEKPGKEGKYTTHYGDGNWKQYRGTGRPHFDKASGEYLYPPTVKETVPNPSPEGIRYGNEVRKAKPNEIPGN